MNGSGPGVLQRAILMYKKELTIKEFLEYFFPVSAKKYDLYEGIKTRQDAILYMKHESKNVRWISNIIIRGSYKLTDRVMKIKYGGDDEDEE